MAPVFPAKNAQRASLAAQPTDNTVNGEAAAPANPNVGLKLAGLKSGNIEGAEGSDKRTKSGKFTLAQLRQTDGIVPLQYGTNQYDSQRGMTGFGMPRDVKGKHLKRIWELEFPEEAVDQAPPTNQAPQPTQQPQQSQVPIPQKQSQQPQRQQSQQQQPQQQRATAPAV